MFNIKWALDLIQIVPKAVAVLPEFKSLWDQMVQTFDSDTDQQTLQDAYDLALSDAADAHMDLQELVKRSTSG